MGEHIVKKYKHEIYAVFNKISQSIKGVYLRKEDYTPSAYRELIQVDSRFKIIKPIRKFYLFFNSSFKVGGIILSWDDKYSLRKGDSLFVCELKDEEVMYWEAYDYNRYTGKEIQ